MKHIVPERQPRSDALRRVVALADVREKLAETPAASAEPGDAELAEIRAGRTAQYRAYRRRRGVMESLQAERGKLLGVCADDPFMGLVVAQRGHHIDRLLAALGEQDAQQRVHRRAALHQMSNQKRPRDTPRPTCKVAASCQPARALRRVAPAPRRPAAQASRSSAKSGSSGPSGDSQSDQPPPSCQECGGEDETVAWCVADQRLLCVGCYAQSKDPVVA